MKLFNRIATPILSILVIPAVILLPMFKLGVNFTMGETRTSLLKVIGLGEYISFKDLYEFIKPILDGSEEGFAGFFNMIDDEKKAKFLEFIPSTEWLITAGVALVIVLLVAVALAIVAAVCKKPGVSVIVSAAGLISTVFVKFAFGKFAYPFLNGGLDITGAVKDLFSGADTSGLGEIGNLLGSLLGGGSLDLSSMLGGIVNRLISVDCMQLSLAHTAIFLIFVTTLIISVMAHVAHKNER